MLLEADMAAGTAANDVTDRRRPGRTGVMPALVPLLRNPVETGVAEDDFAAQWTPRDPAAVPRGIALCIALCAPLWVAVGGLVYCFVW